ncbi:MAG: hypothetical protein CMC74_05180 [Flavobacteriaceae bacterium]|nr:hypothetical protein [Flavobacteriaceae bacterium]
MLTETNNKSRRMGFFIIDSVSVLKFSRYYIPKLFKSTPTHFLNNWFIFFVNYFTEFRFQFLG